MTNLVKHLKGTQPRYESLSGKGYSEDTIYFTNETNDALPLDYGRIYLGDTLVGMPSVWGGIPSYESSPLTFVTKSGTYVSLYQMESSILNLGRIVLIVFSLYAPFKVENMILGGIIKSGGDTMTIMIIDIIGTWIIGIPLCLFAAYVLKWQIVGVYTLLTVEEVFRLLTSLVIFQRKNWIKTLA